MRKTILLLTLTALISAAGAATPTTQPVHRGSRLVRSEYLTLEIMDPAAPDRYYTGTRFTPLAAVIRVQCDGREFLFHKLDPDPSNDVAGLFAEFDISTDPPGFADVPVGGTFVKIGVGRLIKTEVEYKFFARLPVQQLATVQTKWAEDGVTSVQTLPAADGIGYTLQSVLRVHGHTVTIDWSLTNTGTKSFTTQQYHHNCFCFDGRPIGPGYALSLPFDFSARGLKEPVRQSGHQITFAQPLKRPMNILIDYPSANLTGNSLVVTDSTSKMSVKCDTSMKGNSLIAHIANIYLCPEQLIDIEVKPGATQTWRRTYTFDVDN